MKDKKTQDLDYETAKRIAASPNVPERTALATRKDVQPEILYYLTKDEDADVRRAVAANHATPRQADWLLSSDPVPEVRGQLAEKISRLVPNLSPNEHDELTELTLKILRKLAADEASYVRQVVADIVKSSAKVPKDVVDRLARDIEAIVAAPVLQHSPLFSDEDLLDLLQTAPSLGAKTAIANRAEVRAVVADAIAASADQSAIAALLANPKAQIREETLDQLLQSAPSVPVWHEPLVKRPNLPQRAVLRLASFVADALLKMLTERTDLAPDTATQLSQAVNDRLAKGPAEATSEQYEEEDLLAAFARGDYGLIRRALAARAVVPAATVERILNAQSARAVIALVWRADLPMRFAFQVQKYVARIAPNAIIPAKDGFDYPLSEADMLWQLEFFGITGEKSKAVTETPPPDKSNKKAIKNKKKEPYQAMPRSNKHLQLGFPRT